ncbi:hypothetical protein [Niabella drilacis]|uniref:Lipoprotein n=1 Tax=Niabella drilacis (strain DSM 25811 / CCM 8410 / CCUG 62505 / LMG 26954 / E90) TaxID=1285928 RepID=A0A1G6I026_NIADE|nr:hypothetical protein [Niabella drilacis]SDB99743.1 hypothetical protein SAMN04487894_10141 [Niabella drilacis]
MSGSRYIKLLVLLSIAGLVAGCQKNGDSAPGQYTLTTIFENPLPESVSIQYFNARVNPNGDTTILFSGEKILVDANSSTQVVEVICLKDCAPSRIPPVFNMAHITIGDKQRTDINCNLVSSGTAIPDCGKDPSNIFNEASWSVTKKNSGDLLKTYTLGLFEPGMTR